VSKTGIFEGVSAVLAGDLAVMIATPNRRTDMTFDLGTSTMRDILQTADPESVIGTSVSVSGWVRSRRDSKAGLSFIQLSDGTCFDVLQIVAPSDLENYESEVLQLTAGASIVATGVLVASQGKGQSLEMQATEIRVVGLVEDPDTYPISAKRHTFEFLRTVSHLRQRTNTFAAIARVRDCLSQAVHHYFSRNQFLWVHTPIITASDCEGAGEMFRVSTLDQMNVPKRELILTKISLGKNLFLRFLDRLMLRRMRVL